MIGTILIVMFCLYVLAIIAAFAINRLIGSKGRVEGEYRHRERLKEWERGHPR